MDESRDRIELKVPFKPEYVSVARLVGSGVASRIGFDIETIEDIKVALSEVCNKLVGKGSTEAADYTVCFDAYPDKLVISFIAEDEELRNIFDDSDELGIALINAFMDETELNPEKDIILSMTKSIEGLFADGK
jgi:serine/threonine-protein kinase RsbW